MNEQDIKQFEQVEEWLQHYPYEELTARQKVLVADYFSPEAYQEAHQLVQAAKTEVAMASNGPKNLPPQISRAFRNQFPVQKKPSVFDWLATPIPVWQPSLAFILMGLYFWFSGWPKTTLPEVAQTMVIRDTVILTEEVIVEVVKPSETGFIQPKAPLPSQQPVDETIEPTAPYKEISDPKPLQNLSRNAGKDEDLMSVIVQAL